MVVRLVVVGCDVMWLLCGMLLLGYLFIYMLLWVCGIVLLGCLGRGLVMGLILFVYI